MVLPGLLDPAACRELASLYRDDSRFRSRVVMARHGFGRGEYKYFAYPLPSPVARLRAALYVPLAPIANEWLREDLAIAGLTNWERTCAIRRLSMVSSSAATLPDR